MVIVHTIHARNITSTYIFLVFLLLLLLPVSFASTARDPTLRSRLYEQFRCGNGICEVVETALVCPEDCPGEPEPVNETTRASALIVEEKKSGGFERISTLVPDEAMFEQTEPVFSSPQQPEASTASSAPLVILILLIIALIGIVLYALRNTTPFQRLFCRSQTNHDSQLPPPNYPLPTANYPPPTTYNQPPTTHPSTILAGLIAKFTKKGLTPGEIYQRVTRMGLWDDETIRRQLKIV